MMLDVLLKIKDEQARCCWAAAGLPLRCRSVACRMLSPLLLCLAARPTAGCVCVARHRCLTVPFRWCCRPAGPDAEPAAVVP